MAEETFWCNFLQVFVGVTITSIQWNVLIWMEVTEGWYTKEVTGFMGLNWLLLTSTLLLVGRKSDFFHLLLVRDRSLSITSFLCLNTTPNPYPCYDCLTSHIITDCLYIVYSIYIYIYVVCVSKFGDKQYGMKR